MNVSLTPDMEAWIRARVDSGLYDNAGEVVREAMRGATQAESGPPKSYLELVAEGRASIEAGLDRPLTREFWDELIESGRRLADSGAPVPWHISGEW
jgi:antitoxin ParD1/3/4